jgi:hypothetical protein
MNAAFDEVIRRGLARAKASGIAKPVLALLSPEVPQACAIYEDVKGRSLEVPPGREGEAILLPLSPPEAVCLLRRHAGQGGAVAADMLEDPIPAEYWLAILAPEGLHLLAFSEGKEVYRASMGYAEVRRNVCSLTKLFSDDGTSLLTVRTEDGQNMTVCGPSGGVAAFATALAGMALTRQLPVSHEGRIVSVPVDDDQLASFLLNAFNDPKIVAEAIMALKKLGDGKEKWLKAVLCGRPELQNLAREVEHELTGE